MKNVAQDIDHITQRSIIVRVISLQLYDNTSTGIAIFTIFNLDWSILKFVRIFSISLVYYFRFIV